MQPTLMKFPLGVPWPAAFDFTPELCNVFILYRLMNMTVEHECCRSEVGTEEWNHLIHNPKLMFCHTHYLCKSYQLMVI